MAVSTYSWMYCNQICGSVPLFFLLLGLKFREAFQSVSDVERHLELGKSMLAGGQLADALSHYHAAVDGDPGNYLTYFKRATVYMALGKSRSALPDLSKVVELKPDFSAARMQRGNVYLKQGKFDEAEADFTEILRTNPDNNEAAEQLQVLAPLADEREEARDRKENDDFQSAIDILGRLIEISPWDPELRELRADCYIAIGEHFKAIGDLRPTTKLRVDNTDAYYRISELHYITGEADDSLTEIRECLRLDPDHKECYKHYQKVKILVKQMASAQELINEKRHEECVEKAKKMLQTEPEVYPYVLKAKSHICHCQSELQLVKSAVSACTEVLEMDANNVDALCDRAEAYIVDHNYNQAIADFQSAQQADENNRRAQEGLQRAQKLLKQSKKRDYYKILGVRRTAHKRDILKAYRKLAMKWHPDKFENPEERKKAEKHFIDIAAAKEVLTDPEKRQKFDHGEDPLDPEGEGGGNPFFHGFHGFNPFGSGSFGGFKFHFG